MPKHIHPVVVLSASDKAHSGTVVLSGGANVTVGTDAGNKITFSAPAPGAGGGVVIQGSDTTYTSGTVVFTGSQAVTVRSTTGQKLIIDVPAQSVQAETQVFVGGVAGSNTTYTSGTVLLTGVGGGITVSSNTGQRIDLSVAAPVGQTVQTQQNIQSLRNSETTYHTGQVQLEETGGGITIRSTTGQKYQFSVATPVAQSVQTQNLHNVTLSGNTAGAMAHVSSGTLTLAGGNNITLSQAGNAVTISGGAGGAETQVAISGIQNSNTTYTSGTVNFVDLANITIRSTTGQKLEFSVAAPGGGAAPRSFWHNHKGQTTFATQTLGNSTSFIGPFLLPYDVSFSYVRFPVSVLTSSAATISTRTGSLSASLFSTRDVAIFSRGTGASSLSLQRVTYGTAGFSEQWSFTAGGGASASQYTISYRNSFPATGGTSSFSTTLATSLTNINFGGSSSRWWSAQTSLRFIDIPLAASLAQGDYWLMHGISSTTSTVGTNVITENRLSYSNLMVVQTNVNVGRFFEATATSLQPLPGVGSFTTAGGATTASLGFSNVSSSASHPLILFGLHNSSGA